jgi:hypothetical protein
VIEFHHVRMERIIQPFDNRDPPKLT